MTTEYWQDILDSGVARKVERARRRSEKPPKTKRQKSKNRTPSRKRRRENRNRYHRSVGNKKHAKWNEFRRKVYRVGKYLCKKCGKKKLLHAHHLIPRKIRPELTYCLENCVCLCEDCHMKLPTSGGQIQDYKHEWGLFLSEEEIVRFEEWLETKSTIQGFLDRAI